MGDCAMTDIEQIEVDETTKPDEQVVNFAREHNKRRLRLVNEHDLQRALYTIRPGEPATGDEA